MFNFVGLGNPGEQYKNSRHNVGWHVLSEFITNNGFPALVSSRKYSGEISEGVLSGEPVTILFPNTYMNKSGSAVTKLVRNKEAAAELVVVYDDVDLPIGEIKISYGKGSGGHNGVQSIIDALGTKDFIRIRVGIASRGFFGGVKRPTGAALPRHVLGDFKRGESDKIKKTASLVEAALTTIVTDGVAAAMNIYNQ
jgi:PTH1 family peptidyl-tRNA hydrolase